MRNLYFVLIALFIAFLHHGVCAQPHQELFSVSPPQIQIDLPSVNPRVVLRQRLVIVQSAPHDGFGASTLYLNPFEDVSLKAAWVQMDRNANGSLTWYGHIEQSLSSEIVLVWDGLKLAGSITTGDRKYTVRHLKNGHHLVRELDLVFLEAVSSPPRVANFALQTFPSDFERDVLDLVNQERITQNLHPLAWDTQLYDAARGHSKDMAASDYFSHTSLDGKTASDRIEEAGYLWSAAGENIAAGYSTPQAVINGWMNSTGHRQNMLSSAYCDLGVGYAYDPLSTYDHYWTQDFGRRIGVVSCPVAANQPPSAGFVATPVSGLSPLVVRFDASASVDPEGEPLYFDWHFGDGQTGSGEIPLHTYTDAGVYTVMLTVTDGGGASDSLSKTNLITVSDPSSGKYALTIHINGQGGASMSPPDGVYDMGSVVRVTAIPGRGWEFSGWDGDFTGSENPVAITMDSAKTLTATFTEVVNREPVVNSTSGGGGGSCFIATIAPFF